MIVKPETLLQMILSKQIINTALKVFIIFITPLSIVAQDTNNDSIVNVIYNKLSLEDKINVLSGSNGMQSPGIEQYGIPALKMTDGPYGPHFEKAPAFPVGVCLAATWDTVLVNIAAKAMGQFTYAQGRNTLLGPCVNIHRVSNGGRNFESYSEDPWLSSRMTVAVVKGLQSEHVISTVKHFALNNNDWNRHLSDVRISNRALREIYLPSFEAAVKEADAWAIMTSYNKIGGIHASENDYLINQILRKEWKFKGLLVSDWGSVYSSIGPVKYGLDIEMPKADFMSRDSILKYLKTGSITEQMINDKAWRHIYVRVASGLIGKPVKAVDKASMQSVETNNLIRTIAEKGIVLLKNKTAILPLNSDKLKSIAVIGPNAAELRWNGGGSSHITPFYSVSPLNGIRSKAGNHTNIYYSVGDTFVYNEITAIPSKYFSTSDGKPGLLCEYFNNVNFNQSPSYVTTDSAVNLWVDDRSPAPGIARKKYSIRWSGAFTPEVSGAYILKLLSQSDAVLYINNKPAIDRVGRMDATPIIMKFDFKAGQKYEIRVELAVKSEPGQCVLGWIPPKKALKNNVEMLKAIEIAKKSDVAIVCVGWEKMSETEGYDKEEGITLPAYQEELIQNIAKVNPNTIVVINSGTPVWTANWEPLVKGVIMAFYPGHEGGNALANILFGTVNPSGKLPFTFIADSSQSPAFKNYMNVVPVINYDEGIYVGYRYTEKHKMTPTYPFGFGLSYTNFRISNVTYKNFAEYNYAIELNVTNTGKMAGEEVVQLYVSDQNAGVDKPIKELKAFSKVSLLAGETKKVKLTLNKQSFSYFDETKNDWLVESGKYNIMIGNSSENIVQQFTVGIK